MDVSLALGVVSGEDIMDVALLVHFCVYVCE